MPSELTVEAFGKGNFPSSCVRDNVHLLVIEKELMSDQMFSQNTPMLDLYVGWCQLISNRFINNATEAQRKSILGATA